MKKLSSLIIIIFILSSQNSFAIDRWGFFAGYSDVTYKENITKEGFTIGAGGLNKKPVSELEKLDILYLASYTSSDNASSISFDIEGDYYPINNFPLIGGLSINRVTFNSRFGDVTEYRFGFTFGAGYRHNDKFGFEIKKTWAGDSEMLKFQLVYFVEQKSYEEKD
jgi:hypothetical protein